MKTWKQAFRDAVIAGSSASLASLAALALRSRSENGTPWASVNAPSHWLWGEPALRQDGLSLRYTLAALVIHHLSAGFWGVLHEKILGGRRPEPGVSGLLRDAALTTAVAAWVDLRLVPHRLSPGFQRRLTTRGLAAVYGWFGLGLAVGSYLARRRRQS